jgi:hypothetical protein
MENLCTDLLHESKQISAVPFHAGDEEMCRRRANDLEGIPSSEPLWERRIGKWPEEIQGNPSQPGESCDAAPGVQNGGSVAFGYAEGIHRRQTTELHKEQTMTRRDEFLHTHPSFHPGMTAFSDDGQERNGGTAPPRFALWPKDSALREWAFRSFSPRHSAGYKMAVVACCDREWSIREDRLLCMEAESCRGASHSQKVY